MVRIDFFDYLKDNTQFKRKIFSEVKKEIEDFYEYNIVFEEIERGILFEESSIHINNDMFIQFRSLISDIGSKQGINKKLSYLCYNIDLLRDPTLQKDSEKKLKVINKILKNYYSGIYSIIKDLNSFKTKIDEFENLQTNLMNGDLSLDVKTLMEEDFRKKCNKIHDLYRKQKNVILNLSSIFLKLVKNDLSRR